MPEGRCNHFFCSRIVFQAYFFEITKHFCLRNLCSQNSVDLCSVKWHSDRFFYFAVYIYGSADYFTGSHLFYQLAGTVDRSFRIVWIQPLFELTGCIRTKPDSFTGFPDIYPIKAGSLKQHRLYIVCNHGIFSTHDSGDTDLFLTIADHQHIFVHRSFLSVQCCELITVPGRLYHNLMASNCIQVIGVHRLSVFFHHIVGDINQIIDRANAD